MGLGVETNDRVSAEFAFKAAKAGYDRTVAALTTNSSAFTPTFRRAFQQLMKQDGAFDGPIDGEFGLALKQAIRALAQKSKSASQATHYDSQAPINPEFDALSDLESLFCAMPVSPAGHLAHLWCHLFGAEMFAEFLAIAGEVVDSLALASASMGTDKP